jgi:hypothetical protein
MLRYAFLLGVSSWDVSTYLVCCQVSKEDTGAKKRMQSQAASVEDISLEEGLLANQEEGPDANLSTKETDHMHTNGHTERP